MLNVGDITQFSFVPDEMRLEEILESPNIVMWWCWDSEVCPYCKEKIDKRTLHGFDRIGIFIPKYKEIKNCTMKDVIMLGYDETRHKTLFLTIDKIQEALKLTKLFTHLIEGK